jgi:pyrroline-5-carboxylate reductase
MTIRKGATALALPGDVPAQYVRAARDIFESAGMVELIEEHLMSAATSVNGSGPGYFFRIAAVMAECASEQGMDYGTALRLVAQTMRGAAGMLLDDDPKVLAGHVAVPGGTTEAAFKAMDRLGFDRALRQAMLDCAAHAEQLG